MSGETVRFTVPPDSAGHRLDRFLAEQIRTQTRSAMRRLILGGRVQVEGKLASKPGQELRYGMTLEVYLPESRPDEPLPEAIPVDVVHEDDHLLVVMKPAGLVVHPGHGRRTGTLVNALLGRGTILAPAGGIGRPGIVHRLDRETSGLLVVAKTDATYHALSSAFARRTVQKTYQALVWGRPNPAAGTIERAIGRSRGDRTKMSVKTARGRAATTIFRSVESLPGFTLLEITLVTGRTHQIRIHLLSIHHAIVGDTRYGGQPWKELKDPLKRKTVKEFARLALHASDLAFIHPATGLPISFHSPIPEDFRELLQVLRAHA